MIIYLSWGGGILFLVTSDMVGICQTSTANKVKTMDAFLIELNNKTGDSESIAECECKYCNKCSQDW